MVESTRSLVQIIDLKRLERDLEDLNSNFPATKEFLRMRGLENVRDLDERGKKELIVCLRKKYKKFLH